jgi:uncharacterized membrane protein YccC
MQLTGKTVAFVLANTAAVLMALYIAFASDLERPYWAMFTVFIVANPLTGAVRSKTVFRLLGTVTGAAMALLLTARTLSQMSTPRASVPSGASRHGAGVRSMAPRGSVARV